LKYKLTADWTFKIKYDYCPHEKFILFTIKKDLEAIKLKCCDKVA